MEIGVPQCPPRPSQPRLCNGFASDSKRMSGVQDVEFFGGSSLELVRGTFDIALLSLVKVRRRNHFYPQDFYMTCGVAHNLHLLYSRLPIFFAPCRCTPPLL